MLLFKNKFSIITALAILITLNRAVPAHSSFREPDRYDDIGKNSLADIPETAVNIKVIRNFRKSFPQVSGEKWNMDKNHYFVRFSIGEVKYSMVYTIKGSLDYSLKIYKEKHLPIYVRKTVKSLYYDHDIQAAKELYINHKTIYIIHLSNSSSAITLRVCEGEIDEIESIRKK